VKIYQVVEMKVVKMIKIKWVLIQYCKIMINMINILMT